MKKKSLTIFTSLAVALVMGFGISAPALRATKVSAAASDFVSQYRSDVTDVNEALVHADAVNQELVAEGAVLIKNERNTLPLNPGRKISVFGKNSVNPFYTGGGSASGADGSGVGGVKSYTFISGLENAGFVVNPDLVSFYEQGNRNTKVTELSGPGRDGGSGTGQVPTLTGETRVANYDDDLKASFKNYSDAAIIFLARGGGEGGDLRTTYNSNAEGRTSDMHYLELDNNEKDLIEMVKTSFRKIIVVLNMGTSFELGDLKEDARINSILWVGFPGGSGFNAIGKIINGEVTPSGKTVDTYAADFKADPTFPNFASNYSTSYTGSGNAQFVEYDEGIYLGYRYYETRGFVEDDDCAWYDENVVYPFGYGLSYTTFEKSVRFVTNAISADGKIEADVTVKNTGSYPGKEVVEMYYSAPYEDGEIEKSHIVLGAFEKTNLLQPGQSQTLRVAMDVRRMASYDYNDANANGHIGYELDEGAYTVYIGDNAHCWADSEAASKVYNLDSEIYYDTDEVSGTEIENRFDYVSTYFDENSTEVWGAHSSLMTRTDFEGTFPQSPTAAERTIDAAEANTYAPFSGVASANNYAYDEGKPWYTDKMPTMESGRTIKATELVGLEYDDPKWESFMDQLTYTEMAGLVMHGFFQTDAIADLDVPQSITPDGPTGFVAGSSQKQVKGTCVYASPIVVASTWNKELARKMGEAVGDESIWGGDFSGGNRGGYNGWYAPGNNTHRSPFSGRNFEYYSEDPILAGDICAQVTGGAQSKGVFVMMKHFALNDQETNRGNVCTWATEQTMREIYLKSFEIAIKDGHATGIMSAFNRIGYAWTGFSYSLLTEILRDEWGFNGIVITDWVNGFMKADFMVRAGNDSWLANGNLNTLNAQKDNPTTVAAVRRAAHSVLYASVNSNAMNRLGSGYGKEHYQGNSYAVALGTKAKGETVSYNAASSVFSGYKYELAKAPKGITIDASTGAISGTIANDAVAGTYNMVVSLKDDKGYIGQATYFTLTVSGGGITYVGENDVTVPVGEFARIDARSAVNGKAVTYSLAAGNKLPSGMALTADGYIIGKPTAAGEYTAKVVASAQGEQDLTTDVKFTAEETAQPIIISYNGGNLAAGKVEVAYSASVATATGAEGITYTATGLPAGLAISAAGAISGTPTAAGNFTVTVTAHAEGAEDVSANFDIVIADKDPVTPDPTSTETPTSTEQPTSTSPATSTETPTSTAPSTSTTTPTSTAPSTSTDAPKTNSCAGCNSSISLGGIIAMITVLGGAAFITAKKKED